MRGLGDERLARGQRRGHGGDDADLIAATDGEDEGRRGHRRATLPRAVPGGTPRALGGASRRGTACDTSHAKRENGRRPSTFGERRNAIIMKAAVLHAPRQPMTIEDVAIDKPRRREVLVRTAAAGLCHSDLHFIEGAYPTPMPVVLGHESAGVVEAVGEDVTYVQARRPRHLLPVGVLRPLRVLPERPPVDLPDAGGQDAARRRQAADLAGQAPQPVPQPVVVRRADAGPRARAREGARRHAARPRQPDRLQRRHRLRRRRPHGEGRARLDGRGLRRRRHRPGDDQRGADRRRGAHHRRRQGPVQARAREDASAPPTCSTRTTATPSSASSR